MSKKEGEFEELMDGLDTEGDNHSDPSHSKNVRQYKVRKRIEALQEDAKMKQFLDFDSYLFEE